MKLNPLFLAAVLLLATQNFAQIPSPGSGTITGKFDTYDGSHFNGLGYQVGKEIVEEEIGVLSQPVRKSKVPVWLDFSMGANYAECFDKGTVPFRYKGFGANVAAGVTVEWGHWHMQAEGRGFYTELTTLSGTAFAINTSTEFLYHCSRINRWSFWAGGTVQTFIDMKEIPTLMNAASSVSAFFDLCATGMVDYDFAFNREKTHPWLTAFGQLNLPLVGAVNRPGYAYIGNQTINDDTWLGDNATFAKFFPGASTELGLYLNLRNYNRIGLSYRWDYLTTGKKGSYRYDNALHAINLTFMFRVN